MTTNLKIENYNEAKDYYNWLEGNTSNKLIVIHSFKNYNQLNVESLEKISNLLIEKLNNSKYNFDNFQILIRNPNSGSKVDRYKGIWKKDNVKKEFEKVTKYEYELISDEKIYNIGSADLPIIYLLKGLFCLIHFPRWSFILIEIKEKRSIDFDFENIPISILSSDDQNEVYNYFYEEFVSKGFCIIRFGDGGEDWEFSMAYPG